MWVEQNENGQGSQFHFTIRTLVSFKVRSAACCIWAESSFRQDPPDYLRPLVRVGPAASASTPGDPLSAAKTAKTPPTPFGAAVAATEPPTLALESKSPPSSVPDSAALDTASTAVLATVADIVSSQLEPPTSGAVGVTSVPSLPRSSETAAALVGVGGGAALSSTVTGVKAPEESALAPVAPSSAMPVWRPEQLQPVELLGKYALICDDNRRCSGRSFVVSIHPRMCDAVLATR